MLSLRAADDCTNQPKRAAAGFLRQPFFISLRGLGIRYSQGRCVELGGAARPVCQ